MTSMAMLGEPMATASVVGCDDPLPSAMRPPAAIRP